MRIGTVARPAAALLIVATFLALAACGGDSGIERFEAPSSIEVDSGTEFEVALVSNPTTGYEWKLAKDPDPSIAEYVGSEYEPDPGSEDLVGGGGTQTLTFRATGAGTTTLELEYAFSGQGRDSATKREIALTVR